MLAVDGHAKDAATTATNSLISNTLRSMIQVLVETNYGARTAVRSV